MKSTQYTIRSVPPKIDKALRERAKKTGKSLNQAAIEALARGTGVTEEPMIYHDLDWFAGKQSLDKKFDEAMQWLDSLPKDMD